LKVKFKIFQKILDLCVQLQLIIGFVSGRPELPSRGGTGEASVQRDVRGGSIYFGAPLA